MSITHKQLEAALEADSRLVSMGVLCPQLPPLPEEARSEEQIKQSAMRVSEARRKILERHGTLSLSVYSRKTQ